MLAVDQRLRRREEFTAAVRGGRRAGRGSVVIHLAMPTPGTGPAPPAARAGFVVPRAVGNAVVRNRVRRRLRHLVRDRLDALPPGTLLVVRALAGAGGATYAQLSQDLDAALGAARTPRHTRTSGGS